MSNKEDQLLKDLHHVLEYEVQFSGAFAVSMVFPGCPNPGLDIDGAGRVALPLTNQTASLIASVGDQAPCGRGTETILDTTVRDTIQIDASNIRFMNPKWAPALQERVEKKVWRELGCAPFTSPPRCELYKLLLYKPGAHFLPHQDTEKAPGMFATLVVVLPSEFTGGEIHLSHDGEDIVFDNAEDSAFETTILAWYTDVTHEVKEITSGYRLALSYHLINTSPGIDLPHLPSDDSSLQHLREIFHKWSYNEYPSLDADKIVAYGLTHLYSDASLRELIIKGQDHYIASILKQAGDLEGVLVLMGWLNACVEGSTGNSGWQTYEGYEDFPEYGGSTGTRHFPVMSAVHETKMWVDGIQDMHGRTVGIAKIRLNEHNILPFRPFSGVSPDESNITEEYWGNEGASLEFMYKCAALVMFPKKRQLPIMLSSVGGEKWGLAELEKSKSEGPSKENREIIEFLAQTGRKDNMTAILEVAIEWNDAVEWGCIVKRDPGFFLRQKGYKSLCNGWEALKFDGVRPTFEMLFQDRDKLQTESIEFLLFVKEKLPFGVDPQKDEWISAQATRSMETLDPQVSHGFIPGVVGIACWRGLQFASSVILPRFPVGSVSSDVRVEFGELLVGCKEKLIALPQAEGQTSNAELLDHILDEILATAIPQVFDQHCSDWTNPIPSSISSLLSICIPGNRMKFYEDLLDLISRPRGKPFYARYLDLYARILPDLVKLLKEHGISVSSSPSRKFFHYIIGAYLQDVLGSTGESPYFELSMLTCGHETCSRVNDFLRSEEKHTKVPLDDAIEGCVTGLKNNGRDMLFWWHVYRRAKPPCMDLSKRSEAATAQSWSIRLAKTQEFLRIIGTDEEIPQIMGERYQDVVKALEGSQAFVVTETQREEADEAMVGVE